MSLLSKFKNINFFRKFWYGLSSSNRYRIRKFYSYPIDIYEGLLNKRPAYVPKRGDVFTGGTGSPTDFIESGKQQLNLLKQYTNIGENSKVLDIGCGLGRTAIALSNYLDKSGSYNGFDIVEKGIKWCKNGLGKGYPNFQFNLIKLHNDLYTSAGEDASNFQFPYDNNSFDIIFNFSVFTHMEVKEINNYLKEIKRVLNSNGNALCTFFIYDETNEDYIANREGFHFPVEGDGYRLMSKETVGGNIAIEKNYLISMITKAGFSNIRIIDGFWKDEVRDISKEEYQDIVVFS